MPRARFSQKVRVGPGGRPIVLMGNCIEKVESRLEDEETEAILRSNPWMRKLPFIG